MARKQKMKVYHGIPKSITDEHTLFYESCDGKLDNSYTVINPISFYPNVTGYGVYGTTIDEFNFALTTECNIQTKVFTVDFWATMKTPVNSSYAGRLFEITFNNNSNYKIRLEKDSSNDRFHLWENANLVYGEFDFSSANVNKPHHFRIIFKVGDYCKMYIDGKEPNIVHYQNKLTTSFEYISHIRLCGANFSVSDFHISNIDRGDYFPNLPQDFIEGKAIIKPRMGQQQIKGDPMYSQVSTIKIPAYVGDNINLYQIQSNQKGTLIDNPEVFDVDSATTWQLNSSFKIKGLNGEVISGVIDTDTALCKVLSYGDGKILHTETIDKKVIKVSTVNALSVGDTVILNNTLEGGTSALTRTVVSIDSTKNLVTFQEETNSSNMARYYLFEITTTSSVPIVKTSDGTTVTGTWSGLGTNEATFTLGENSNITGKDLYVQYALTMPYGNSDFPELPYSIEKAWGENGVEMKPTSTIQIFDDFKHKISNSIKECPHESKMAWESTLQAPSLFTKDNVSTSHFNSISELDGVTLNCAVNSNGKIPQQLFVFDIIELIERKLGCEIPSANKVEWIKNNYERINIKYTGYGTSPSGNLVKLVLFNQQLNTWMENWLTFTESSPTTKSGDFSGNTDVNNLIVNGKLYLLAYTNASDGVNASNIFTDYISIRIDLKVDSTYTALYCENIRAREDKCNPVLIQKETKTVKRYLPSKEYFVTENTKLPYKDNVKTETGEILYVLPNKVVTTNGTTKLTQGNLGVDNYTDKIVLPSGYNPYNFDSSPIRVSETDESNVSYTVQLPIIRYWGGRKHHGVGAIASGLDSCQTTTTVTDKEGKQQYEMYAGLKKVNNELKMVIRTDVRLPNNNVPPSTYTNRDYKLPNRPLIK